MIVLIGESACGKSSVEKELEKLGYRRVISYTTRKRRASETDNAYHFVTQEEFLRKRGEGFFAETDVYNGAYYGTAKEDCTDDAVAVLTPGGLKQVLTIPDIHVVSFHICVSRADRMIAALKRGDDIDAAYQRNVSDTKLFRCASVDWEVRNEHFEISSHNIAKEIDRLYREAGK